MISSRASNWVDRGTSPVPVIHRVLAFFFDRHGEEDQAWLQVTAEAVVGMVEAHASEVQIAGYLKAVAREQGLEFPPRARLTSIAVWHIAKVALVRDMAERLMSRDPEARQDEPTPLNKWLAAKLLTAKEFAQYESDGRPIFDEESPYS